MSNLYNPTTKGSDLSKNGETISSFGYTLEKTILKTYTGQKIEISNLVNNILIDETLYTPYSKVTFQIVDATKFLQFSDLRGDEEIECVLKRTGRFAGKFKLILKIAEISGFVKKNMGRQFYKLVCLQKHMYEDQKVILSRSFEGSPASLISSICRNDLKMQGPITAIAKSKGQIKGIYPLVRPLTAINWLVRNSFDNGAPIFFYHTIQKGFVIVSYKDLLEVKYSNKSDNNDNFENDYLKEYRAIFGQGSGNIGNDQGFYLEEARRVTGLTGMETSQYVAIGSGAYSSNVVSLDISTKELTSDVFKYGQLNSRLEKEKPFVDPKNAESEKSKTYYINTNQKAFNGKGNYHSPTQDGSVAQYEAYRRNLNMNNFRMSVPGDFNMEPGAIIRLKVITPGDNPDDPIDKYMTGKYLVKEVQHSFDEKYTMKLTICRDSFHRSNNNDST